VGVDHYCFALHPPTPTPLPRSKEHFSTAWKCSLQKKNTLILFYFLVFIRLEFFGSVFIKFSVQLCTNRVESIMKLFRIEWVFLWSCAKWLTSSPTSSLRLELKII
jgi:hypothetical protein